MADTEQDKIQRLVEEKRHIEMMDALKSLLSLQQKMIDLLTKLVQNK